MVRDFQREARDELARKAATKNWIALRIKNIHDRVSAHDILRKFGVTLRHEGSEHEEQFSCPFHGQDRKPSARVYPSRDGKPSGVWCFVCQEPWDAISLWRKYTDETVPFAQTLAAIEREYSIPVPEPPRDPVVLSPTSDLPEGLQRLLDACETRLRTEKEAFDIKAHLTLGVLVDRVRWQVLNHKISPKEAEVRLRAILDKIGEKVRCHGG